jgi:hypothetical protein
MIMQEAMIIAKTATEIAHFQDKAAGGLVAVVDMDFHIPESLPAHVGKRIQQLAPVFFLGIKEAISWSIPHSVTWSRAGNPGPDIFPARYPAQGRLHGGLLAEWLVVVSDGDPQSAYLRSARQTPRAIAEVAW